MTRTDGRTPIGSYKTVQDATRQAQPLLVCTEHGGMIPERWRGHDHSCCVHYLGRNIQSTSVAIQRNFDKHPPNPLDFIELHVSKLKETSTLLQHSRLEELT